MTTPDSNIWNQSADEYELTDEDVDYIFKTLEEDGHLDSEPSEDELRAEVQIALARSRFHGRDREER